MQSLLSILSDGHFHSGDELGRRLGVSRTAVWKRIKRIEELGLPLLSKKGHGYCIPGGLDLLSRERVEQSLSAVARGLISELELLEVASSTNEIALDRAATGARGYVCTAEQQTRGRGRRGRTWVSPYGANIYLSVVWEFAGGATALGGLSLALGVAIAEALAKAEVPGIKLKWPNDILVEGGKLAGVLVEMVGDAAGSCQVVVGVGVNVSMPDAAGAEIDQSWTDVRSLQGKEVPRSELLALLLNEIMPLLAEFEARGFAHYRDRWQALDVFAGQEVFMRFGEKVEYGVAAGVDASGALLVDTPSGRKLYNGGEVSLRSAR